MNVKPVCKCGKKGKKLTKKQSLTHFSIFLILTRICDLLEFHLNLSRKAAVPILNIQVTLKPK